MRTRSLSVAVLILLLVPAAGYADTEHLVLPGETLTSVAATDGLTVSSVAAANHISVTAELIAGELIEIPPLTPATSALQSGALTTGGTATSGATTTAATTTTAAATSGVTTTTTATAATPTAATTTTTTATATSGAVQPAQVITTTKLKPAKAAPHPTLERVDAQEIATVAASNNVPVDLAEAIAWQESGWNNDELSASGAVGVMQITPSTWRWIDQYLTPGDPLNGRSAVDNVRAGVLLLHQLLTVTGTQRRTIEAYYQGLASIEQDGVYSQTKRYAADVLAIERQLAA
jgi:hypothetical protein